jgi:hypothetical protein
MAAVTALANAATVDAAVTDFHPCAVTPKKVTPALDWSFVDAAYCISLRERQDRADEATAAFNAVGLAPRVTFYRPRRHATDSIEGIWESHCAVARHALAAGHRRVAIFEDDVRFDRGVTPRKLAKIARALRALPADWRIFYLGHWPVRCRVVSGALFETASGCTHAYIASRELLEWLRDSDYAQYRRDYPRRSVIGKGIDSAFFRFHKAYALFPMLAIQSPSPSDHRRVGPPRPIAKFRHLVTRTRLREKALSLFMRPNEAKAVALAVLRRLIGMR